MLSSVGTRLAHSRCLLFSSLHQFLQDLGAALLQTNFSKTQNLGMITCNYASTVDFSNSGTIKLEASRLNSTLCHILFAVYSVEGY